MRKNIQKITTENGIIKCGNIFTIDRFCSKFSCTDLGKKLGTGFGNRRKNKEITEILGITPSKYTNMIRGAMYNLWIVPHNDLITKLCFRNGYIVDCLVHNFHLHKSTIMQYKNDGLDNLLPLAMAYGRSTIDLKNMFGKKEWKVIHKNSFSKNKAIFGKYPIPGNTHVSVLNGLPTSIINKIEPSNILFSKDRLSIVCDYLKRQRSLTKASKQKVVDMLSIVRDTERMAIQLGEKFSTNRGYKRILEDHNEMINRINIKKDRELNKSIGWLQKYKTVKGLWEGIIVEVLDTPAKIKQQGIDQNHCVGSYIEDVKEEKCIIVNIVCDGIQTTFQAIRDSSFCGSFLTGQHKGAYNSNPPNRNKAVASKILSNINACSCFSDSSQQAQPDQH